MARWQDTELRGLPRSVSDHCALMLMTRCEDWGPKPFRFINEWLHDPGFKEKVHESWSEGGIQGWASFVVKEKLKRLRETLKVWNREQFGNMDQKVELLREELKKLDEKDESMGLMDEEELMRSGVMAQLLLQFKYRKSHLAQRRR